MKPTCKDFEPKKSGGFISLPPVGAYVAEIQNVRLIPAEGDRSEAIEMMIEITEGEFANRYHEVWQNQNERFGTAKYKGVYRLYPYSDSDPEWKKISFSQDVWCVQESNPGYKWDWDENKLKGKKIGINVRKRLYTFTNSQGERVNGETTEIGRFETIADVKAGKCRILKDRDQREKQETAEPDSTDGGNFTDVSKSVEVPWD